MLLTATSFTANRDFIHGWPPPRLPLLIHRYLADEREATPVPSMPVAVHPLVLMGSSFMGAPRRASQEQVNAAGGADVVTCKSFHRKMDMWKTRSQKSREKLAMANNKVRGFDC